MLFLKILFWISLFIVFYSYLGYGMLLWAYLKIFGKKRPDLSGGSTFEPAVTIIIATYNEAPIILKKIENTLALDYPSHKLKIIFVADGTTDESLEIISQYPRIQLRHQPGRAGKVAAINRAMKYVDTPFTIFSDANTLLNPESIRQIIKHYNDPSIGAVAGEKKVIDTSAGKHAAGAGEGLYWKYESKLKELDAAFYSVVGAAGELFSIRTELFEPVDNNILLDDFIMSMKICTRGFRVMYEPLAFAAELPSLTMKDEQKRKIRISAGGFQSVVLLKELLNIFKYGRLSFQYISHRVLRWVICPLLLPVIFLINLYLYLYTDNMAYQTIFYLQCVFYLAAIIGWIMAYNNVRSRLFYVPYYFVFMNISLYIGFFRFIKGSQSVLWDKASRHA